MNLGLTQGMTSQPLRTPYWRRKGLYIETPAFGQYAAQLQIGTFRNAVVSNSAFNFLNAGISVANISNGGLGTFAGLNSSATLTIDSYTSRTANTATTWLAAGLSGAGTSNNFQFNGGTNTKSGGQTNYLSILPTYTAQTSTAANTDFLINRTETAIGSGTQLLIDAQVATVSKFSITNTGVVNLQAPTILKGYTVATLPATAAAGRVQGAEAFCTDLTTPTYMAVAVGGGAVVGKVFWDGTNWIT